MYTSPENINKKYIQKGHEKVHENVCQSIKIAIIIANFSITKATKGKYSKIICILL